MLVQPENWRPMSSEIDVLAHFPLVPHILVGELSHH